MGGSELCGARELTSFASTSSPHKMYQTRAPQMGAQPLGSYSYPQQQLGTFQFMASAAPGYNTATAPTMYNLPTVPSLVPTPLTTPAIGAQAVGDPSPKTRVPE